MHRSLIQGIAVLLCLAPSLAAAQTNECLQGTGAAACALASGSTLGGAALTGLATASVPLSAANGGIGSSTVPAPGQIPVGNSGGTAYAPQSLGGDVSSVSSAGAVTIGKLNGVSHGSSPATNTVAVVTSANTTTYEAVPDAAISSAYSGTGSCTNQVVTGLSRNAPPACSSLTQAMAPSGFHRSFWSSNGGSGPTSATTVFFPVSGIATNSATEGTFQVPVPVAATIKNLFCNDSAAPGSSKSDALTVRSNAASTSITCTISGTATTCSDATHTLSAAAGALIDIQDVTTGGSIASRTISCGVEVDI